MNTVKVSETLTINLDNVAYTEDYDQCPPGLTVEEAFPMELVWPVTMVVFNAPAGEYGVLKVELAHDERTEFFKHFTNGHAA